MSASLHFLPSPEAEAHRLAAVRRYDILDTPPDGAFDRITAMAADLFSVPISVISIVDHDRIWVKSRHGLEVQEIGRSPGLCASAILHHEPWVLTDARSDPRAFANPLVAGEFGLRFYIGVPLRTHDGFNLGTLCVIDRTPRAVTDIQLRHLRNLASLVMDQMELRLAARRAVSELTRAVEEKDAAAARLEVMAKESDHRVTNSLQFVSSLLALQRREAGASAAAEQLGMAAARVAAIARVHQHIHQSDDPEKLDCTAYLRRLAKDLSGAFGAGSGVEISVDGPICQMPTRDAAPVGLVVSELVTNAVKHRATKITILMRRSATGGYLLSVTDDGEGLPADFDPAVTTGLGMKVVSALLHQIGGELSYDAAASSGARFTIRIPAR